MPHDKIVVFFSFSFFKYLLAQRAITFKAYIFGGVSVRDVELLAQVFWLLKFIQKNLSLPICMSCQIHHRSIFSKFDSFACVYMGQSLI